MNTSNTRITKIVWPAPSTMPNPCSPLGRYTYGVAGETIEVDGWHYVCTGSHWVRQPSREAAHQISMRMS